MSVANGTSCQPFLAVSVRPDTLTDVDCYNATVLADRQLVRGGIRLACLLNMIFG